MPDKPISDWTTFGKLLKKDEILKVPSHQREYSWTPGIVRPLWSDIVHTITEHLPEHFMGSVLFSRGLDGSLTIIDGQQRLATLSLLIQLLREARRANGQVDKASSLAQEFIADHDTSGDHWQPRLRLGTYDAAIYDDLINDTRSLSELQTMQKDRTLPTGARNLIAAYIVLREQLYSYLALAKDQLTALTAIEDVVTKKLSIVYIEVAASPNAYLVFETLNQRGLRLAPADLIKNYLFAVSGDRLPEAEAAWTQCLANLGPIEVSRFMRHYWVSRRGLTRGRSLYAKVKSSAQTSDDAVNLIKDMRDKSRLYAALSQPTDTYWDTFPPAARQAIEDLVLFRATQAFPILLAAHDHKWPNKRFAGALRFLAIFTFRYSIIGKGGTGPLESAYGQICQAIQASEITSPKGIYLHLKELSLFPEDPGFTSAMAEIAFPPGASKLARYALATIESNRPDGYSMKPETSSLEHIIPQNPSQHWISAWPKNAQPIETYIYRFGNLALLPPKAGKKAGSAPFAEKRLIYKESPISITKELGNLTKWGPKGVESRQRDLAKEACSVWGVTF